MAIPRVFRFWSREKQGNPRRTDTAKNIREPSQLLAEHVYIMWIREQRPKQKNEDNLNPDKEEEEEAGPIPENQYRPYLPVLVPG